MPTLSKEDRDHFKGAKVQFTVLVDEVGSARTIRAISGPEELRKAFTQSLQRTQFHPGMKDGQPIRRWITLTYTINPEGVEVE